MLYYIVNKIKDELTEIKNIYENLKNNKRVLKALTILLAT